jgi:hypothetical protein
MKVQGPSIVHSLPRKMKRKHKMVIVEVLSKDMGDTFPSSLTDSNVSMN